MFGAGLGHQVRGLRRGPHLREEFICRALDSILAPMSSMPLPLKSTFARQVLLPRALMRMLVRSFSRESATDSDCRDCVGEWGVGPGPCSPRHCRSPPRPRHSHSPLPGSAAPACGGSPPGSCGESGLRVGGEGLGSCYWSSRKVVRVDTVSQKDRPVMEQGSGGIWRGPHLALTLKFLPRNRCLRDLFFPSAGTSVRRSESNPGQQMERPKLEARGSRESPEGFSIRV